MAPGATYAPSSFIRGVELGHAVAGEESAFELCSRDARGNAQLFGGEPWHAVIQGPWPQAALAGVRQAAHLCSRQTPALHAMVHLTLARCPPASGARAGMGQCARIVVARAVVALGRAFMQLSGRSGRPVGHRSAGRGRSTSKDEEAIDSPLAPGPKTLYEGLVSFQAYLVCYALGARNLTRITSPTLPASVRASCI